MLHQTFSPNTWFADVVQFGTAFERPITYILFVHANSRYAVLVPANLTPTVESEVYEYDPNARKNTDIWLRTLSTMLKDNTITNLITDYEPAFKSDRATIFYQRHGINHFPVNVSQEGHIRLSILDRLVRTLRDMIHNAKLDESNPEHVQSMVKIYNKTRHGTLTKHLGLPTTPKDVYEDPELEAQFVRSLRSDNWSISHQPGYIIPEGTRVVLKALKQASPLIKSRGETADPDEWEVISRSGQKYTIRNIKSNELRTVIRTQIKRVPHVGRFKSHV